MLIIVTLNFGSLNERVLPLSRGTERAPCHRRATGSHSVIPIRRDIVGIMLCPIVIPAVKPLIGCAITFTVVAPWTGKTDISSLVSATLIDGNNMFDGEARAVKVLTVGTIPTLGRTQKPEMLRCD